MKHVNRFHQRVGGTRPKDSKATFISLLKNTRDELWPPCLFPSSMLSSYSADFSFSVSFTGSAARVSQLFPFKQLYAFESPRRAFLQINKSSLTSQDTSREIPMSHSFSVLILQHPTLY